MGILELLNPKITKNPFYNAFNQNRSKIGAIGQSFLGAKDFTDVGRNLGQNLNPAAAQDQANADRQQQLIAQQDKLSQTVKYLTENGANDLVQGINMGALTPGDAFNTFTQRQNQPAPERNILKDVNGIQRYQDSGLQVFPDVQAQSGTVPMTPEQRASYGISPDDPNSYQITDGKVSPIGGSGVNVTTNILPEDIPGPLLNSAIESSNRADTLDNQVREIKVFADMARSADTGALTPMTLPIKQMFRSFGLNLQDDVPVLEAMQAQQNQMALRLRNPDSGFGLTGNTSDRDVKFLKDAVAGIEKTPAGNIAILTIMEAKQRRVAAIERLKSNFIFENGTLNGWTNTLKNYVDTTPFFTQEEEDFLSSLKQGMADPLGQNGAPQQDIGVGESMDLGGGITITRNN